MNNISQIEKAKLFRKLHHSGKMLVLPNIWDALGAMLLESLDYPSVATASASFAYVNGYLDGENIPFGELLSLLKKITRSVNVPVSADIESGYAENDDSLRENIKLLIDAGIAGINIEDTNCKTRKIQTVEYQCNKISLIRDVSGEMGIPLFINARTDVYLQDEGSLSAERKLKETIKRGLAYKQAGADGFYPITLKLEEDIKTIITEVNLPINILTIPGIPDLNTLNKLGVARISLGPAYLKIVIRTMKELALQLKEYEGMFSITDNYITSDYLKSLVTRNNQAERF